MPTPTHESFPYVKREYLSYSTLMSFVRCPRKYFYSKCGVTSPGEPTALQYGTAMHMAVDIAITEGLEPAMAAFARLWDDSLKDDKRSLARARSQLQHFIHTHSGDRAIYKPLRPPSQTIELDSETSPFEIPFVIDIGLPIPLAGRLDGWGVHRDTGKFWAREFKTTSRLTGSLLDSLELNPQILSYALIARTVTGRAIEGVMFEAMLIDKNKVDNITHPISIQPHMLDDVLVWLQYWGSLLLACEAKGEFPKNFAGCSAYPQFYMPGSTCEYHNLCRVADWRMLADMYEHHEDHRLIPLTVGTTNAPIVARTSAESSVN